MFYVAIKQMTDILKVSDTFSENDLYVKLTYDNQVRVTTIQFDDSLAVWNEQFLFNYTEVDVLQIDIYDDDNLNGDDLLSHALIIINRDEIRDVETPYLQLSMGNIFHTYLQEVNTLKDIIHIKIDEYTQLKNKLVEIHTLSEL